eukprot:contig_25076_g6185
MDGVTLATARADIGYTGALEEVALPTGAFSTFLELHIEQGPNLEATDTRVGVVFPGAINAVSSAGLSWDVHDRGQVSAWQLGLGLLSFSILVPSFAITG